MSSFAHVVPLAIGGEKVTNTTKKHPLGTVGEDIFGNRYHYCFSQGTIGAGQVTMSSAGVANHDMDLAVQAAAAIGAQSISVTLGATAATANQYADGLIYVNDGPGEGHRYRIKDHLAADASATLKLNLYPNDKVKEALTTADSLCGLMESRYTDVEVFDVDDVDGAYVGIAPTEVADNAYFWCQFAGEAAVLIDTSTVVLGNAVQAESAVDGAVGLFDVSGNTDNSSIGVITLIVAVSTDYGMVILHGSS